MSNELIAQLASEIGVSVADVRCLAQSIANDLVKDKAADFYLSADSEAQIDLADVYARQQIRKFDQFSGAYQTRPEARALFQRRVLELCKEQVAA